MSYQYDLEIADLVIRMESLRAIIFDECFQPFLADTDSSGVPDIQIDIRFYDVDSDKKKDEISGNVWCEGNSIIQRYCLNEEKYIYRIESVDRKDYYCLKVPDSFADAFCNKGNLLLYLSMDRMLLPFKRMLLHASAVIYEGKAYVFAAPSGGGKSTHAGLWEQYYGAEILNGDKVIIKVGADGCMAYGGPVAGSSGVYKKKGAPVASIIFLEKGNENKIREEKKYKMYLRLYSELIKSTWDGDYNCHLLEMAETVIRTTPVMTLSCKANRGAVECIINHLRGIHV